MKYCSVCKLKLSDSYSFCTNCGGGLGAYSDDEPTLVAPKPVSASNLPPTMAAPAFGDMRYSAPTPEPPRPSRLGLVLGVIFVFLVLLLGGIAAYYFWLSTAAIERKLDAAISRGNLVTPEGSSAYDYYHDLKQRGVDASVLARYDERLLPLLTARPKRMLEEFIVPANPEPMLPDWQEAMKPMSWASEMKPADNELTARAKYIEGRVAFLSAQKDQALTAWKRANDLDKSWAVPTNGLGIIFIEKKDYQTARAYLLDAIHRDDAWAVPYNNVGTTYFFEKNDDKAESYYKQAVERAPNWPRPHAWLGDIAMHRQQYEVAAEEYQKVLDLAPPGSTSINLTDIKKRLDQAKKKSQEMPVEEVPD